MDEVTLCSAMAAVLTWLEWRQRAVMRIDLDSLVGDRWQSPHLSCWGSSVMGFHKRLPS